MRKRFRFGPSGILLALGWAALAGGRWAAADHPSQPRLRRPVALVLADGDRWLFTANRRTGTVSAIDASHDRLAGEAAVGRQLADLEATPDGRHLLALDELAHELVVLVRQGPSLEVVERVAVSPYPVSVSVTPDGAACYVASLWSRRVTAVDLAALSSPRNEAGPPGPRIRVAKTLALPFAPREQLLVRGGTKLIVADSFGGHLAVIDAQRLELLAVRELAAHNIRGLGLDGGGRKLLVSHQILNSLAETNHNDVHWGVLMTNVVRWLMLDHVLAPDAAILRDSHVHQFGESSGAGGDPAGLAVGPDGTFVVALAGVGKLAFGKEWDSVRRVSAGRRPTAVVTSRDARLAYVADTFGDSVSVVDLETAQETSRIALGPQPELSPADEGELLFYDARLSLDGWYSCHSCHTDGHTNGLATDNLGDGSFGAAKRVLSLLGAGRTGPWAWNGSMAGLESQIRKSVESTMQGDAPSDAQVAALAAWLATLRPPPPLGPMSTQDDPRAVARGRDLFDRQLCANCHLPPEYTSPAVFDVGLADGVGNSRFNPPALWGVSQGGPYFHDGRAATLEEVFTGYRHQLQGELAPGELEDLVSFLRTL